jgi:hypothetical protein
MATAAQDIAALKRAVKELDERVAKIEAAGSSETEAWRADVTRELAVIRDMIEQNQHSNDTMLKVVFRQLEADRLMADQRHTTLLNVIIQNQAVVMAQFEKLLAQPPEN